MILIVGLVFGPYVFSSLGIRTEQLIVYPVFLVILIGSRMARQEWRLASSLPIVWSCLLPVGLFGSFFRVLRPDYDLSGVRVFANADAILLGAAMAWLGAVATIQSKDPSRTFYRISTAIVIMVSLNGVVAIVSTLVDSTSWLSSFWSSQMPGTTSVAVRALTGARYSGIFNQPYEAGLAHSVAFVLWCYLLVRRQIRPMWLGLLILPLVLGGLLPVSKLFILGGLPLGLVYLIWVSRWQRTRLRAVAIAAVLLAGGFFAFRMLPQSIRPIDRFLEVFGDDTLARVSGNRYGIESVGSLDPLFGRLWESPIFGFGLDPQIGPFDNAVLAQMILGGVIGMIFLLGVLWMLTDGVIDALREGTSATSILQGAMLVLLVGSMLGAHPFLVNRASSLLLLSFGMLRGMLLLESPDAGSPVPRMASVRVARR